MRLHLVNSRRLAEDLAAGKVPPREQATYLALSFVAWIVPYYLGVSVWPVSTGPFGMGLYWSEFGMLIIINWMGVFHCLRRCRVDPARHFMIDFGCLYTPASIVALVVTWAAFHATVWLLPRVLHDAEDSVYLYSRTYDLLRYFTIVGQVFLGYLIVGHYMRRAAELRAG